MVENIGLLLRQEKMKEVKERNMANIEIDKFYLI